MRKTTSATKYATRPASPGGEISALGKQLLSLLFQNAFKTAEDAFFPRGSGEEAEFQIPTAEILKNIPELNTIKHLRKTLESLAFKISYSAVDGEGKKRDGFLIPLVLAETEKNGGICRYAFNRRLPELMADPDFKARMSPSLKRSKGSKYGRLIYELCFGRGENGQTPFVAVEELKNYLEVPKNSYPEFKIFNRDVLKPALKEINEQTDLTAKLITRKTGRKITSLSFGVTAKAGKPAADPLVFSGDEPKAKSGREKETINQKLASLGMSKKLAEQLSQIYSVKYLSFAASVLNKHREKKSGENKDPDAILLKIIKLRQKRPTTKQASTARDAARTRSAKQIDERHKTISGNLRRLGGRGRRAIRKLLEKQKI